MTQWPPIMDHRVRFDFVSNGPAERADGTIEFANACIEEVYNNPDRYPRIRKLTVYNSDSELVNVVNIR